MNKYEIRRANLLRLKREFCGNSQTELARRIGRQQSYVSRMLSSPEKPGHRKIADDMVDIITTAFNLPVTWLDVGRRQHPTSPICLHVPLNDACFNKQGVVQQISKEPQAHVNIPASFGEVDACRVIGEDLSPRIRHRDVLVIAKAQKAYPGEDVWIRFNDQALPTLTTLIGERDDHFKVLDVNMAFGPDIILKARLESMHPVVAIFRESYTVTQ